MSREQNRQVRYRGKRGETNRKDKEGNGEENLTFSEKYLEETKEVTVQVTISD